jgi:hypothetical protein
MLKHTLNPARGGYNFDSGLAHSAPVASTITDPENGMGVLYPGRAVHLGVEGGVPVYRTGCHHTGMTLFSFSFSDDPGVRGSESGDPASDEFAWSGFGTEEVLLAFPASGGFELESTEYDPTASFPPNTPLTSARNDADIEVGGVLVPGEVYVNPICGVVSSGLVPSGYSRPGLTNALRFWPVWLPQLQKDVVSPSLVNSRLTNVVG